MDSDGAREAATEAAEKMDEHLLTCVGATFTMPRERATITCDQCGTLVYDGPMFEADA